MVSSIYVFCLTDYEKRWGPSGLLQTQVRSTRYLDQMQPDFWHKIQSSKPKLFMPEAETPYAGLEDTGNLQEIHSFLEKYLETWLKALDHLKQC